MEQEFLKEIVEILETLGIRYAISGSVASNLWGVPRLTHDVDILIVLGPGDVARVVEEFGSKYYISGSAVEEALRNNGMFNVVDSSRGVKADFWVSSDDEFSANMMGRKRRVEILPGTLAEVGSPEDILLHKLVWYSLSPSERQLADAAGIAAVQTDMDLSHLRNWADKQGTRSLLEDVLQGKYLKKT